MDNQEKKRARTPLSATIMIKVILSIMVFTMFLQGVDAWTNTTFNNSLSTEDLRFYDYDQIEYYTGGSDGAQSIQSVIWWAQTFAIGTLSENVEHALTSVRIRAYRSGTPETATFHLRAVDSNGLPTGSDLANGTTNASTLTTSNSGEWREIEMSPTYILQPSTNYSIVIDVKDSGSDRLEILENDTEAYTGGNSSFSVNSGSTWSSSDSDLLFDLLGVSGKIRYLEVPQATTYLTNAFINLSGYRGDFFLWEETADLVDSHTFNDIKGVARNETNLFVVKEHNQTGGAFQIWQSNVTIWDLDATTLLDSFIVNSTGHQGIIQGGADFDWVTGDSLYISSDDSGVTCSTTRVNLTDQTFGCVGWNTGGTSFGYNIQRNETRIWQYLFYFGYYLLYQADSSWATVDWNSTACGSGLEYFLVVDDTTIINSDRDYMYIDGKHYFNFGSWNQFGALDMNQSNWNCGVHFYEAPLDYSDNFTIEDTSLSVPRGTYHAPTREFLVVENAQCSSGCDFWIYSPSDLQNASFDFGQDAVHDWNYSGVFNHTNNRTDLLTEINSYISGCTIENGFCVIPFVFQTATHGIYQFLDLLFNNDGFTENSQSYLNETWERSLETFEINVTFDSARYTTVNAFLYYDGTAYAGTTSDTGNERIYSANLNVPEVDADTNYSFYWQLGMYDGTSTVNYNSQTFNQTVKNISLDDCSVNTNLVYNFTVRDEELRTILTGIGNNVTINVDLRISAFGTEDQFLTYANSFAFTNPATICLADPLNSTAYRVDLIVDYSALDYVQEFYFVDNGTLSNATMPQHIDLHDLLATDSTSFLFTFIDIDGLEVDEAIVHVDRFYIGEGVYREVERGKSDESGETHIHLVEEDVIYRFRITKDDQLLYTSTDYHAKCLSTPCEIVLRATGEYFDTEDETWDTFDDGSYTITKDDSNRQISLTFVSDPTAFLNMNFTAYKYEDDGREIVASDVLNATAGTITLTIPQSYGNVSYVYAVYQDDELIVWGWFSLVQKGVDFFGGTLGVILTALMVLTLGLMAVVEGIPVLIFLLLGLLLASILNLIDLGWVALISLISAGGILIWKLAKRRTR